MSCIPLGRDRRGMTISVTILGLAVLTILLAYLAFGDNNDQSDIATVRFVAIVSIQLFALSLFLMDKYFINFARFIVMVIEHQLMHIQMIHTKIMLGQVDGVLYRRLVSITMLHIIAINFLCDYRKDHSKCII